MTKLPRPDTCIDPHFGEVLSHNAVQRVLDNVRKSSDDQDIAITSGFMRLVLTELQRRRDEFHHRFDWHEIDKEGLKASAGGIVDWHLNNSGEMVVKTGKMDEHLEELIKVAVDKVKAMTPEEKENMLKKQAESWVKGEMQLDKKDSPFLMPAGVVCHYLEMLPNEVKAKPDDSYESGTSLSHLKWMLLQLFDMTDESKAMRWLGFIQYGLIDRGFTTVTKERDFTRPYFGAKKEGSTKAPNTNNVYRHKKTGGLYNLIGIGRMQADGWFIKEFADFMETSDGKNFTTRVADMAALTFYQSQKDGSFWARPTEQFNERFEEVK